jgi:hypothetical protein
VEGLGGGAVAAAVVNVGRMQRHGRFARRVGHSYGGQGRDSGCVAISVVSNF